MTFSNGDEIMADFEHGIRNGDGVVISTRNNIARLCGNYKSGKLQGKGKLVCKLLGEIWSRFCRSELKIQRSFRLTCPPRC